MSSALTPALRACLRLFIVCSVFLTVLANAQTTVDVRPKLARAIIAEASETQSLLTELSDSGSSLVREVLMAWTRDGVFLYDSAGVKIPVLLEEKPDLQGKARAIRIDTGEFLKDEAKVELRFGATELVAADTDSRLRGWIQQTLDALALADPDPDARRSAVLKLGNSLKLKNVAILQARLNKESDAMVKKSIEEAIATLQLSDPEVATQVSAATHLGNLKAIGSLAGLKKLGETDSTPLELKQAVDRSVKQISSHISFVNFFGTIFRGLSLGSILLVVALGLAITFGLMGIINMAHGEMIAMGAYTCYVVQNLFGSGFSFSINLPFHWFGKPLGFGLDLPGLNATGWLYDSYFLFALPLSFLTAAMAGIVLERFVIRFLYRRPLESLLATWGVSLVMQQLFRMVFGANNVQVSSPPWLQGHFTVNDILFGYNRVFVVVFAALIVLGTWLLLTKTPLGLLIRAGMQNRDMAACMGVRTNRVNLMTFAFGSGLAGLAGAFLSQIGNVGPSLGQSYIVDAFMTVVVGGVGSIVGTVFAAVGIGTSDQVLQQVTGSPVTGKIVVLVCIILFLQWKPGGLFSLRSRGLEG